MNLSMWKRGFSRAVSQAVVVAVVLATIASSIAVSSAAAMSPPGPMAMPATQLIFPAIESGDLDAIRRLLDEDPGLVHVRHADAELHHWTALQFAAANIRPRNTKSEITREAIYAYLNWQIPAAFQTPGR